MILQTLKMSLFRVFFVCLFCHLAPLCAQELPANVVQSLQKVHVMPESMGVYVQEISPNSSSGVPLISWRANAPMQPASTMKLVTSYAALDMLGAGYAWKTSVYMTGHLDGDVLVGDLILQGGGDPHLVLENFWTLLRQIRAKGIREIQGNLVIDNAWMEPQVFDAAEFDGDPTRPYNVGPDPMLVNFNVLSLVLRPDGNSLRVESQTPLALQSAVNVTLVSGACGDWRSKLTPTFSLVNQQIKINLSGSYPLGCEEKTWMLQPYPLSHGDYVGVLFRGLWKELGGQLDGNVVPGVVPVAAQPVTDMQSEPLPDILRDMNKYSNNVMARLVMLTLDKEAAQSPANAQRAAQLTQLWFARLGIEAEGLQLDNGSGLSRNARISPAQMGRMLNHAFASTVMPEFMASLPLLGVDGTMQKRAASLSVAGHAHLKTGGLEGVRNFAGYLQAVSGRRYVIVCFVNDKNARQTEAAQDELMQWVYDHG
ncbi:D-alanyl-D-alanine carboxypeptidase/D-alanyl-D-alanine-endopeptidase (penicillin-binding protein 4) [Oxalobacteraceae bacterium GrIS 2.11]